MLRRLITLAGAEPVLTAKLLGSLLTIAALFGLGDNLDGGAREALIGLVLAGLAFHAAIVRSAVVSPGTLVEKVADAAYQGGTETAAKVNSTSAGKLGEITGAARDVVAGVTETATKEVVETVGGIAGGLGKVIAETTELVPSR